MKNLLLIGASGGIGGYLTSGLAISGFNLALHYNSNIEKLKESVGKISNKEMKINLYQADLTDEASIKRMIESVKNDFGSIDVMVNSSGVSINAMTWKFSLEDWNKVISVNLTGTFLCTKHVLPVMKEKNNGRIIYISSVVPLIGVAGTAAYSSTKAGIWGLCKTVAKEVLKNNITVNMISLGYFDAGLLYQIPEELRMQIKESIPLKKFGNPDEIVECIHYICSERSSYLTGQNINLNGGLY